MLMTLPAGLALGSSYALLAVGFTLVFGVLRRVNLAYGATVMLGIYGALWVQERTGGGPVLMLLIVLIVTVVIGIYVEKLCFAPHSRRAAVTSMAASFAVWMQLEEVATLLLPGHALPFPSPFGQASGLDVAGFRLAHLLALGCALSVCAGFWALLYRTGFGLAVRALIESRQAAACAGIDVPRISALIFVLASALGAVAGWIIVGIDGQVTPMFAMWATLKGIIAAILGGLGSLPGAVAGGLLLGVVETVAQRSFGPQVRDLCSYLLLFAVLALCPSGLSALWSAAGASRAAEET
ncbi:branched-chain amino acid ABC transporter permease [Arenibaculum sp.]|uniref:branched-chain amino acid ABC transporter permease n=1 Tax=Arenibaculum sp. TaxID=2865862 RepID=UPI002E0F566C|nr:branched-chain amino acid ABC transporter permease [Arenibaculum sp.]